MRDARKDPLPNLIKKVVKTVGPLRIVVFGSTARNGLQPGNDVDLLVVMPEGTHRRKTAQELYRRVRGVGVSFDIVVATPADLERHKDNVGLIYRTALREGKEVYVA